MTAIRWACAAVLLAAAGCAHRGYFLDESTKRIYTRDGWGRITKWYEPGTDEYNAIALRFWPGTLDKPSAAEPDPPGRRSRLASFMKGLDKDQWHILLDLDMWTGDDRVDLSRLEDMQRMAVAVKGMTFNDYLDLKRRYPIFSQLRARLLRGE